MESRSVTKRQHELFLKCRSQKESVAIYLKEFKSITAKEAMNEFGIWRLSAIIWLLIHKDNVKIGKVPITKVNRFGNYYTYAKYVLK